MKNKFIIYVLLLFFCLSGSALLSSNIKTYAQENLETSGKATILTDEDAKNILYSKNEKEHYPIASMCKIMTLNVVFDSIKENKLTINQKITVSENSASMGGSQVFLEKDGVYTVDQLIKSIVVASANDACVALAEQIAGSEEAFVNLMNQKCKQLNMNDTVFTNCTGLPKVGQYSCALDCAKMFSALIKNEVYFNYSKIWMDEIKHPKDRITQISNTNKLLKQYDACDCGKTGFTSEAGFCLTASAKKGNLRLISVTINSDQSKCRFNDAIKMFDYGFNNYECKVLQNKDDNITLNCNNKRLEKNDVLCHTEKDVKVLTKKNEKLSIQVETKQALQKSEIKIGDTIGFVEYYKDGKLIFKTNLIAKENVNKKVFGNHIADIIKNWDL